jgi:hypothetical protein
MFNILDITWILNLALNRWNTAGQVRFW